MDTENSVGKKNSASTANAIRSAILIDQLKNFNYLPYPIIKIGLIFITRTLVNHLDLVKIGLKSIQSKNSVNFKLD